MREFYWRQYELKIRIAAYKAAKSRIRYLTYQETRLTASNDSEGLLLIRARIGWNALNCSL